MNNKEILDQVSRKLFQIEAIAELMIESVEHDSRNWVGSVIKELSSDALSLLNDIEKDGPNANNDLE